MATVRFYLAAIVLGIWTMLWALGVRGEILVGFFLGLLTVATIIMQRESVRRWKGRR